jgi:hypothetical protein
MKIIITEEQFNKLQESNLDFNKTKTLINTMYDAGQSIDDILNYTGLDKGVVIISLYDREMINDKKTEYEDKYNFLYGLLWDSGLITKDYNYEDGSRVSISKDSLSGALNFNYRSKEGYVLSGMATLMWDSENGLPIDITYLYDLDGTEYDVDANVSSVKDLKNDNKLNNIKTLRQLIDYFNNDYYIMLKEKLNPLLEEAINDYL